MPKIAILILAAMLPACEPAGGDSALDERIEAAKQQISHDTCFRTQDPSLCDWDDFEIGRNTFNMARRSDESILVADEFTSAANPFLLRYRNRILSYYEFDEENDEFAPKSLVVRLPRTLGRVLVSFAGPEFIPASALTEISKAVNETYRSLNLAELPGHGAVVLGHLVDLVPEQPLVVVNRGALLSLPTELCSSLSQGIVDGAKARIASRAASLRAILAQNNVRYVNASFGSTTHSLSDSWSSVCHSTPPGAEQMRSLLSIFEPVYETLFNTPGVIAAQASAEQGDPADYPFDQRIDRFANRLRVGHFSSTASGLDGDGRGALSKTGQFPVNNAGADVYLNWGCVGYPPSCSEPHYQAVGDIGMSQGTVPIMSSSYITPLAVARLVYLRNVYHPQEPWTNDLVAQLQSDLRPPKCGAGRDPCLYQDPIAHRELEIYRLGYK